MHQRFISNQINYSCCIKDYVRQRLTPDVGGGYGWNLTSPWVYLWVIRDPPSLPYAGMHTPESAPRPAWAMVVRLHHRMVAGGSIASINAGNERKVSVPSFPVVFSVRDDTFKQTCHIRDMDGVLPQNGVVYGSIANLRLLYQGSRSWKCRTHSA
jgi:hypothetical protein